MVAGAGRFVQRTHPSGLNSMKGSWLCDWPWPISPRTHLVLQAHKDQTPSRMRRARHQFFENPVMHDIATAKQKARKAAIAVRKIAHDTAINAPETAAAHLLKWLESQPDIRSISGYMPIRSEIDILPAMHALYERGYRVSVPVIIGKSMPLKFRAWVPDAVMVAGPFGAMVPKTGAWQRPDLLLCPLLAFDASGQRLGYGGGFYDRSIAELTPVLALGYAYGAQQVETLPHEATDMPLDGVVTENGVIWTGQ